jgi:hypothetical protein
MANKASFTPEEWTKVLESVAVTAAEPSGLWGMIKEALAGGAALAAAKADPNANELVKAVIADFETVDGRARVLPMQSLPTSFPARLRRCGRRLPSSMPRRRPMRRPSRRGSTASQARWRRPRRKAASLALAGCR